MENYYLDIIKEAGKKEENSILKEFREFANGLNEFLNPEFQCAIFPKRKNHGEFYINVWRNDGVGYDLLEFEIDYRKIRNKDKCQYIYSIPNLKKKEINIQ